MDSEESKFTMESEVRENPYETESSDLTQYSAATQIEMESFPSPSDYCDSTMVMEYGSQSYSTKFVDLWSDSWSSEDDMEQERRSPKSGAKKKSKREYTVGRGKVKLRKGNFAETVSKDAVIYMAAVLGFITEELLYFSNEIATECHDKYRIEPIDITYAITSVEYLAKLFPKAIIEEIAILRYDRKDDLTDNINLAAENILEDKFTSAYGRFCSSSLLSSGIGSCRYGAICICPLHKKKEYVDIEEPVSAMPVGRYRKRKVNSFLFDKSYRKLKNKKFVKKIRPDAAVYLKAVIDFILIETMELIFHCSCAITEEEVSYIKPTHVSHAYISDKELRTLYPLKIFSSEAAVFLEAVLKYLVKQVLERAVSSTEDFRKACIEPIDILFAIEIGDPFHDTFPSMALRIKNTDITEITRFKCDDKFYCCKRLVRSGKVIPETLGCSGMQLNKLSLRKKAPLISGWSRGIRRKAMTQRKWLKGKITSSPKVDVGAAVCGLAITDYLTNEVLRLAGDSAIRNDWRRIEPVDLFNALGCHSLLYSFYPSSKLDAWIKIKFGAKVTQTL